jgi:hypothetical protein
VKTALWIENTAQYERLAAQHEELAGGSILVTSDPSVLGHWREENLPHRSLWHYTTLEEQVDVAQEALDLAGNWLRDSEVLSYQGVHLGELCQTTLLYTFRDAILAQRMAERFFEQIAPTRLFFPTPGAAHDEGRAILKAAVYWEARRRNVPTEDVTIAVDKTFPHRQGTAKRIRRIIGASWANALWKRRFAHPASGRARVMFFGGGADFVNQFQVIERLRKSRPYPVIHVSLDPIRPSAYSRTQTIPQQEALHLLPYYGLRQYMTLRALGQHAWQWFQHRRRVSLDNYPELFQNPGLDSIFQRFFLQALSRAGGVLDSAGRLMDTWRPGLVVLNSDAGGRQQAIIHAARQRGIPSAQMIHSGFNDLHFRRCSTDQIWVWGDAHRRQFASLGTPERQILITGNPNYDYLVEIKRAAPRIRAEVRKQLGLAESELALLMATAQVPRLLTFVDMEQHALDLEALCQTLGTHSGIRLIIKPHPRYDDTAIYRRLTERYPWVTLVEQMMLDRLLPASDAVIMANSASTAAIEALLLDRPVIWIRPSTRYPPLFSFFEEGVLTIDRRSEIGPILGQFVDSPEYRESVRDQGRQWLPTLVANRDGSATEAVVNAIDRLVGEVVKRP